MVVLSLKFEQTTLGGSSFARIVTRMANVNQTRSFLYVDESYCQHAFCLRLQTNNYALCDQNYSFEGSYDSMPPSPSNI